MAKKDYYQVLGVKKDDSIETIKKSYKKLALKFHPDKASDERKRKEYEEKFKEINEAYTTLSDEEKRSRYNTGETNQFNHSRNSGGGNFSDIFGDLFRGGSFGGDNYAQDLDIHYRLTIEFTEAAFGCEKEFLVEKEILCNTCNGTGSKDNRFDTCDKCDGNGTITVNQRTPFGVIRGRVKCDKCDGEGQIPKKKCSRCNGVGIIKSKEKIKIKIPAGIDNGQTLRITDGGSAIKNGLKGDLLLSMQVKPHKIFIRKRFDVFMDFEITFSQAALGDKVSIPTLSSEKIKIKIPKGTESGNTFRLKDKGIPFLDDPHYFGDQFVNVIVKTPRKLTKAQEKLFKELGKLD